MMPSATNGRVAVGDAEEEEFEFGDGDGDGESVDDLDYHTRMKEVLRSGSISSGDASTVREDDASTLNGKDGNGEGEDEDEDGFVYAGADAEPMFGGEEEVQEHGDYNEMLGKVLGSQTSRESMRDDFMDREEDKEKTNGGIAEEDKKDLGHPVAKIVINGGNGRPEVDVYRDEPSRTSTPLNLMSPADPRTPRTLTPSHSVPESISSSVLATRPRTALHPSISRLRSRVGAGLSPTPQRYSSHSPSIDGVDHDYPSASSPAPSSIPDRLSRQSSYSNVQDFRRSSPNPSDLLTPPTFSPRPTSESNLKQPTPTRTEIISWAGLRRISSRIYPPPQPASARLSASLNNQVAGGPQNVGRPTVLAASGIICVGTDEGWVQVFDYGQNLQCICGTEAIAKDAGAVTALAISHDHTFIAVGHSRGSIYLYDLKKPNQPARSVPSTDLAPILAGRKEGHLTGTKILHLGFVAARHTAIVSADETGLAFYHHLGQVLGLANTDIIRILGRYPDPTSRLGDGRRSVAPGIGDDDDNVPLGQGRQRKPTTVFAMSPLPLGPAPHPSDTHSLVALLTPSKLIIVGLKPSPRTWWRLPHQQPVEDGKKSSAAAVEDLCGALAWRPSVPRAPASSPKPQQKSTKNPEPNGIDPLLAFSRGRTTRLVRVISEPPTRSAAMKAANGSWGIENDGATGMSRVRFEETGSWGSDGPVSGLQWLSERVLLIMTPSNFELLDVQTMQSTGVAPYPYDLVVSHNFNDGLFPSIAGDSSLRVPSVVSHSVRAYKGKIFLLTISDLRVATVLSWADRILSSVQRGNLLEAIDLTTSYYQGQSHATTIGLPADDDARHAIVEPKLRDIMTASLEYVFSPERLTDELHRDPSGRGVDRTSLFEGLVTTCAYACLATGEFEFLLDDVFDRFQQSGIDVIYLENLEPFILSGSIHAIPPAVVQKLITLRDQRGEPDLAERIIWHVDPMSLDINQALNLCHRERLYDALIHVYTRSMRDFIAPLVELIGLIRRIQRRRRRTLGQASDTEESEASLSGVSRFDEDDVESLAPDAYKIYYYISDILTGCTYPSKDPLDEDEANQARNSVYSFLFSGRSLAWPSRGGDLVLTSDEEGSVEPTYPYLRQLLRFDAEAMLGSLDAAFEDPYLNEEIPGKTLNRQMILNLLLELMSPSSDGFTSADRIFLYIFVARNLPKYPQFLMLPPSNLNRILANLATDTDQSTREDRQLAAEYMLSTYTPLDADAMLALFERAGFFRILRSVYKSERRWPFLASTILKDTETSSDIFVELAEVLDASAGGPDADAVVSRIVEAVPQLVESGVSGLAMLINQYMPSKHQQAAKALAFAKVKQFAYLRCLFDPEMTEAGESFRFDPAGLSQLDDDIRLTFIDSLCEFDRADVISFLERHPQKESTQDAIIEICDRHAVFEAVIWQLDRTNRSVLAFDRIRDILESRGDRLLRAIQEAESSEGPLQARPGSLVSQVQSVVSMGIRICVQRSASSQRTNDSVTPEEAWFRLLASVIELVRCFPPGTKEYPEDPSSLTWTSELRNLVPQTLSALISSTSSQTVSFPRLMRRLIDQSASRANSTTSYAEFRSVITSMLGTYRFEEDLLRISNKIVASDLFEHVEFLQVQREKGWRPGTAAELITAETGSSGFGICAVCGERTFGEALHSLDNRDQDTSSSANAKMRRLGLPPPPIPLTRKPSLKGKEVYRQDEASYFPTQAPVSNEEGDGRHDAATPTDVLLTQAVKRQQAVVVMRTGKVFHRACFEATWTG